MGKVFLDFPYSSINIFYKNFFNSCNAAFQMHSSMANIQNLLKSKSKKSQTCFLKQLQVVYFNLVFCFINIFKTVSLSTHLHSSQILQSLSSGSISLVPFGNSKYFVGMRKA